LEEFFHYYNYERCHDAFGERTPAEVYLGYLSKLPL
jgi:transposase InsO family protein